LASEKEISVRGAFPSDQITEEDTRESLGVSEKCPLWLSLREAGHRSKRYDEREGCGTPTHRKESKLQERRAR